MKKVLILLCVALLLAALVLFAYAEETAAPVPDDALVQEVEQLYADSLYAAGKSSFFGMCGTATGYQLWELGINESLLICDGNKQFDTYKDLTVTTGGHDIKVYSAEEYSLTEALNAISQNGTRTVRNILIGFQWTDTEAGAFFGHSCVINVIQDGLLYFTESFNHALGKLEGKGITCTIDEFVDFYDGWTTYEGVIWFGTKQYANSCQSYGTDLYVQLRFESNLRSQPCLLGQNESVRLRSLAAGEVLRATAVYVNGEGDLFYQIDDGGVTGYVSANAVHLLRYNQEGITLEDAVIPTGINLGEVPILSGAVHTTGCEVSQLRLEVTDDKGSLCAEIQADVTENVCDLATWNASALQGLTAGSYTLTLVADTAFPTAENGMLTKETISRELLRQSLLIGLKQPEILAVENPAEKDGWFVEKGTWYCYEKGQPRTGWTTRIGVRYFLQEDGAVTTGWMDDSRKNRYFSGTGALCTGWFTTPEGTYYCDSDGVLATGFTDVDGVFYYFGEDGILAAGGSVTVEGVAYRINPDGTVAPK